MASPYPGISARGHFKNAALQAEAGYGPRNAAVLRQRQHRRLMPHLIQNRTTTTRSGYSPIRISAMPHASEPFDNSSSRYSKRSGLCSQDNLQAAILKVRKDMYRLRAARPDRLARRGRGGRLPLAADRRGQGKVLLSLAAERADEGENLRIDPGVAARNRLPVCPTRCRMAIRRREPGRESRRASARAAVWRGRNRLIYCVLPLA